MEKTKPREYVKLIETIVYCLLIVAFIFANSYCNIYIKMLPMLFVLGVVGNLFFGRPIITTVFGIITSICVVYMKERYGFFENIFISFNFGLNIALGEIAGLLIKKAYSYIKNHDKSFDKDEVAIYIITIIFMFIFCPLFHGLSNGNIVKYNKAKSKLEKYLKTEYNEDYNKFQIVDASYKLQKDTNYIFKIKYENKIYIFKVYTNDKLDVVDGYKQYILEKNNTKIKNEFDNFIKTYAKDFLVSYDEKNNNIYLSAKFDVGDEVKKDTYINPIIDFLDNLKTFKYIESINIVNVNLKDTNDVKNTINSSILLKSFYNLNSNNEKIDYVKNSFDIEYIDN